MEGERLAALQTALGYLTGSSGQGATARYARFQSRERVVLIPFTGQPGAPTRIEFAAQGPHTHEMEQIRQFSAGLQADGGTAIYDTLAAAYQVASEERARDPQRLISVVLLTDGLNRDGMDLEELKRRMRGMPPVRTFPILFGNADSDELEEIAMLSGGRTFDGTKGNLVAVFREIRGYQ
jgi:Ca-activated chloride channel family protein